MVYDIGIYIYLPPVFRNRVDFNQNIRTTSMQTKRGHIKTKCAISSLYATKYVCCGTIFVLVKKISDIRSKFPIRGRGVVNRLGVSHLISFFL